MRPKPHILNKGYYCVVFEIYRIQIVHNNIIIND